MSANVSRRTVLKYLATAVISVPSLAAVPAQADNSKPLIYTGRFSNTALQGYDPVSYFNGAKPVKGDKNLKLKHENANWLFSSEENRAAFTDNPELYVPQFGGYCAFSIAQGKIVKGDATLWAVVDDKLYINFNKGIHRLWLKRSQTLISRAQSKWPSILG